VLWSQTALAQLCGITQITNGDTFGAIIQTNNASINADGTRIAFHLDADLTGGNADRNVEIFLFDSNTNIMTQVTNTTSGTAPTNHAPSINADGTRIAFESTADLTGENPELNREIFLYDSTAGTFTQLTENAGIGQAYLPSINADGTRIAFESNANPTGENPNGNSEIYLIDMTGSTITQVTNSPATIGSFSGPMARIFLASGSDAAVASLRDTAMAFAPGLVGYGLVAVLTRALYARGLWKAPTACVVGGWLLAVAADVVLATGLPSADRALALGAGHSLGVTVAGGALLVVTARAAGARALRGLPQVGGAAALGALLGGAAGWWVSRILDADPVPDGVLAAVLGGVPAGATALVVGLAVMMVVARAPLATAWRELRSSGRQEVHGG
jgi:Tol biopolymer transport system component